jgi:bisphosphoglycerate-independent phosphoglycerate mutase (AlkP superfamily)
MHDGVLADVAPTLLQLVDVPVAQGMTGKALLEA